MIALVIAFISFIVLFFIHTNEKEGFEEDYRSLIIASLLSAKKDSRMKEKQMFALEDALRYAKII
jgi:hypothetical protein